MKYKKS